MWITPATTARKVGERMSDASRIMTESMRYAERMAWQDARDDALLARLAESAQEAEEDYLRRYLHEIKASTRRHRTGNSSVQTAVDRALDALERE